MEYSRGTEEREHCMFFHIWWASHIFIIDARFFICFFNDRQLSMLCSIRFIFDERVVWVAKTISISSVERKKLDTCITSREKLFSFRLFRLHWRLLMSRNVEDLCEIYFTWNMNKYLNFDTQNRVHSYTYAAMCFDEKENLKKHIQKQIAALTRWWRKWRFLKIYTFFHC